MTSAEPDTVSRSLESSELAPLAQSWLESFRAELAAVPDRLSRGETKALYRVMHDAKGLARTFGYTLVADIASRLVDRLRDQDGPLCTADGKFVMAAHAALAFVLERGVCGDGGDVGRAILLKLDALA